LSRKKFAQRQYSERGGQGSCGIAFGIGGSDQRRQRLAALGRNMRQCRPEFVLQRDTGAMAGEGEAALDQSTQPPPPGRVAPDTVIAADTARQSKFSGRTLPGFTAACCKVTFSARASLPMFTALIIAYPRDGRGNDHERPGTPGGVRLLAGLTCRPTAT
jgi:hypothetical protein